MGGSKEVRMPEMYRKKIEKAIGEPIDVKDENQFFEFDDIDDKTMARIRRIYHEVDEIRAIFYLKFVMASKVDDMCAFSFLFDVVIGQMDRSEWGQKNLKKD